MHPAAGLCVVELKDGDLLLGAISYESGLMKVSAGLAGRPILVELSMVHDVVPAELHPELRIVRSAPEKRQRQGVYVAKWTQLSIPAGRLRIRLGADGTPVMDPLVPHLVVNMWPHWLDLALGHWRQAKNAHARLLDADVEGSSEDVAEALNGELQAATQAISAAAFCMDALYGAVRDRSLVPVATLAAWERNKTKRATRIYETFRAAAKIPHTDLRALRQGITLTFKLRDQAVHPRSAGRDPVVHPILGVGVEQRYVEYTADNAHGALSIAIECVYWLGTASRLQTAADVQWANALPGLLDDVLEKHGVTITPR
ncbi:MAG: hypothetical protein QOE64_1354 [Frankiales bacterium]|nr:hypothetical protein [Frankiales bacterium]